MTFSLYTKHHEWGSILRDKMVQPYEGDVDGALDLLADYMIVNSLSYITLVRDSPEHPRSYEHGQLIVEGHYDPKSGLSHREWLHANRKI